MSELLLPREPGQILPASDIDPRLRSTEEFQMVERVRFETLQPGSEILYAEDGSIWYLRVEEFSDSGRPRVMRKLIDAVNGLNYARGLTTSLENVMTLMGACDGIDEVYGQPKGMSEEPQIQVARCLWFLRPEEHGEGWEPIRFSEDVSRPIQRLAVAA